MTSAEVVGYSAIIVETEETYTHLYSDGEDTKKAEAEALAAAQYRAEHPTAEDLLAEIRDLLKKG